MRPNKDKGNYRAKKGRNKRDVVPARASMSPTDRARPFTENPRWLFSHCNSNQFVWTRKCHHIHQNVCLTTLSTQALFLLERTETFQDFHHSWQMADQANNISVDLAKVSREKSRCMDSKGDIRGFPQKKTKGWNERFPPENLQHSLWSLVDFLSQSLIRRLLIVADQTLRWIKNPCNWQAVARLWNDFPLAWNSREIWARYRCPA